MAIARGLYEKVIDREIELAIDGLRTETRALDPGDSHSYLIRHLAEYLRRALASFPEQDRINCQIELTNRILALLAALAPDVFDQEAARVSRPDLLLGFDPPVRSRPDTPLNASYLMTGTRQDPSLVSQLRKEILTADRVDLLCSFIKWSGVRILEDALVEFTGRGGQLRVITTSYLGATELKAVKFLSRLPGTEIKVSYDSRRTRLHAKAYIIHRETGFGVAYIGSSNISQAALTDGLEWNVKISQDEARHLWEKITATFDTYWNDAEFASYREEDQWKLARALSQERQTGASDQFDVFFDLKPYPFQEEILDLLRAEREVRGRKKNLVVAATGTGKTVIAAYDYKRFNHRAERARLLFVAHREEILRSRPMSIIWRLRHKLPARLLPHVRRLANS